MKKKNNARRILSLLLVLVMLAAAVPQQAYAAVGDLANVDTGLDGNIDTSDTISLPIKIYDYEADGMLFEYAESNEKKDASDFGATWYEDYTVKTDVSSSINTGNYWSDVTLTFKKGTYANYVRAAWAGNTTANWTGNRAGVVIADFSESSTYTADNLRYLVLVYRSNVRSGYFTLGVNCSETNGAGMDGNYTGNIALTTENDTYWTYAVIDLKNGSLGSKWGTRGYIYGAYVGLPIDESGEWMDIAHVAFFSDKSQAEAFGEYALTDGSDRGDNRGFGLLRSSRKEDDTASYASVIDETGTVEQLNTYGDTTSVDMSTITTLGYTLLGIFGERGIANVGLLESSLSAEGYPVYKKEVVDYVAGLLKHSLEISERTSDGWKNYRYVKGSASEIYGGTDLAAALRSRIKGVKGSYAEACAKDLVGTWAECEENISSYYDAAYFLLNSIFVEGSYNTPQDDYDYLILSAGTRDGEKIYVFDGGFTTSSTPASALSAVKYDTAEGTISNSGAEGKTHFYYELSNTTTLNPFLPVTDKNNASGQTQSVYYQDDGILNTGTAKDTYRNRNFNYVVVSEGEFVYHADDDLYFNFEGDDDVYLFVNGELVMDIGSAHSIDSVKFNLNDYVNAAKAGKLGTAERNKNLSLEEGNTYSFKFYYMERHGYGANIRVETNIRVTDPSMTTQKTAYQSGVQLDFGSIVDKEQVVEYGFAITNNGEENLYNLTFSDSDIGVNLDPEKGLTVTGTQVYDVDGGTLDASDLTAIVSHPEYDDITVTFTGNDALKAFLARLASDVVVENGGGLWVNSTVLIRGIGYRLTDAQVKAGVFDNTVLTTSTNKTESKKLQGQATMRVFVPADPMYYQWAGHDLKVTFSELVTDVLEAAAQPGNVLAGKVPNLTTDNVNKIVVTAATGTSITHSYVDVSEENITINYPKAGSYVFYLKITYNESKKSVVVPVLVNVTDVENSVYVLDYGLGVDLTENGELYKNDAVTVPGRDTKYGLLAIGTETPSYAPNNITFRAITGNVSEAENGYGKFSLTGNALSYLPTKFIEGMDTIWLAMNVYEADITPSELGTVDISDEVQMYKSVAVLPANVVYYEDDFPAITYNKENSFKIINGGSSSLKQSADQDTEYGSDGTYADGNNTQMSGNSLHMIKIEDSSTVASFIFKGSGFELIGRTNASDSATLIVKVKNSEGKVVKSIPVINEYDNGADGGEEEIYQVPVVRVDGLTLGTYTVEISGVPARDYDNVDANGTPNIIPTYLYIDGLRIYQPMGASNENYNDAENDASFAQIRNLIVNGKVAAVDYDNETVYTSTGTVTWTENRNGVDSEGKTYTGNQVDSVNDYLTMGPNNEVYINGDLDYAALVFYVVPVEGAKVNSLQIAVHAVDAGEFFGAGFTGMNAKILYGIKEGDTYKWADLAEVKSGTEQYYTIDLSKCPALSDGKIQVAVALDSGMASFTSLKYNGVTIESINGESTTLYYDNGILKDAASGAAVTSMDYPEFESISAAMYALAANARAEAEPEEEETEAAKESTEPAEEETEFTEEETETLEEETETSEEETSAAEDEPSQGEDESESFMDKGQKRADMIKKLIDMLKKLWGMP